MIFCNNSNFILNLCPKEEKFIQINLFISKTSINRNSKVKSATCNDNSHTSLQK
jgi:hypothetical protein